MKTSLLLAILVCFLGLTGCTKQEQAQSTTLRFTSFDGLKMHLEAARDEILSPKVYAVKRSTTQQLHTASPPMSVQEAEKFFASLPTNTEYTGGCYLRFNKKK